MYLFGNRIGVSGAASLSQALEVNSSLTNLDLRCNSIGDSGAASLSQALAVNSSLTNLDLSWNSIGASGATALSHVSTVNTTVHVVFVNEDKVMHVDNPVLVNGEEEEEEGDKEKLNGTRRWSCSFL